MKILLVSRCSRLQNLCHERRTFQKRTLVNWCQSDERKSGGEMASHFICGVKYSFRSLFRDMFAVCQTRSVIWICGWVMTLDSSIGSISGHRRIASKECLVLFVAWDAVSFAVVFEWLYREGMTKVYGSKSRYWGLKYTDIHYRCPALVLPKTTLRERLFRWLLNSTFLGSECEGSLLWGLEASIWGKTVGFCSGYRLYSAKGIAFWKLSSLPFCIFGELLGPWLLFVSTVRIELRKGPQEVPFACQRNNACWVRAG